MSNDVYCAEASSAASEPLYGTAVDTTNLWLVLEHEGPWGAKGLEDSQLPAAAVQHLLAVGAKYKTARIQLARRPGRSAERPHLWLARTEEHRQELWQLELTSVQQLTEISFGAWLDGDPPAGARKLSEPLFFVCVHGKRDRCCAQRGMPVYSQLSRVAGERAWMTTHLGGHRFAATLVVLPHGIAYGRVEVSEVAHLVQAHARREVYDLSRMRGRTAYPAVVQAGEILLRQQLGERGLDALCFVRLEKLDDAERVVFRIDGREHAVTLGRERMLPVAQSCGAEPKSAVCFVPR